MLIFGPTWSWDRIVEQLKELASSMDANDAFVIFPEGANYTEKRRARAIRKLRTVGRPDLAERAESLRQTLPPRSTGVKAALAAAPRTTRVTFIGHAGLETLITATDIWRAIPMGTVVAARIWRVSADKLPPPAAQEAWLYDIWAEIDQWICEALVETEEPVSETSR